MINDNLFPPTISLHMGSEKGKKQKKCMELIISYNNTPHTHIYILYVSITVYMIFPFDYRIVISHQWGAHNLLSFVGRSSCDLQLMTIILWAEDGNPPGGHGSGSLESVCRPEASVLNAKPGTGKRDGSGTESVINLILRRSSRYFNSVSMIIIYEISHSFKISKSVTPVSED